MKQVTEFLIGYDVKDILGTEAVNHFKALSQNGEFTDETLNPWKEVKRRNPASPWYVTAVKQDDFPIHTQRLRLFQVKPRNFRMQ